MLRAAVAAKTPLGLEAKKVMDAGGLVSDEIVVGMIEENLDKNAECKNGYVIFIYLFLLPRKTTILETRIIANFDFFSTKNEYAR